MVYSLLLSNPKGNHLLLLISLLSFPMLLQMVPFQIGFEGKSNIIAICFIRHFLILVCIRKNLEESVWGRKILSLICTEVQVI